MSFHTSGKAAIPGFLALPLLASFAMAQRSADVARPLPQNPEVKTSAVAAQGQVQIPAVRDTHGLVPSAQTGVKGRELAPLSGAYRFEHDRLYVSNQPDGSPQARGRTFKAEFTPTGATYIPFCGSAAPTNHPLSFQIAGITSGGQPLAFENSIVAGIQGSSVSYARGSVTEVYELGVDSVEQKFVFASLPTSGELDLRLAVATDMSASYQDGALLFTSADGSVRYGAATAVDASGKSIPATTELVGGGIDIRVPASFLATATFPVTIDPVITTYTVNYITEPVDSFAPAIAWDETNQRYAVVYEEVFSATDHDTDCILVSPAGAQLSAFYVDTNLSAYWANPDVANNNANDNFFVVAEVGSPTGGAREIHGRLVAAASGTLGSDVLVSTTDASGEKINASVGGDPFGGTSYYTVVWQRIFVAGVDDDVHYRQVDPATGALLGTTTGLIDNSGGSLDRNPRISKSCQNAGTHHVVWARWVSGTDRDVYAAEVIWNGTISIGSTAIATGTSDTTAPACSPIDNLGNWLLGYEVDYGTDHDIFASHMTGVTVNTTESLSYRESAMGTGNWFQDQRHPAFETDGVHFAYAYSEQFSTSATDYDIYVSSLDYINSQLVVGEFFQNLAYSGTHEDFPRMCSQQSAGGSSNKLGIIWSDTGGTNLGDIEGAVYGTCDFTKICSPFWYSTGGCPCSNNPPSIGRGCENSSTTGGASLNGSGNASISNDTAQLSTFGEKPTATSVVAQGPGLIPAGVSFGQGLRCAGPAGGIGLKRLYTKTASGGSITAPVGADPTIHARSASLGDPLSAGMTRYYYVYYRDPSVLGGCSATFTFNATDTLQVIWRP